VADPASSRGGFRQLGEERRVEGWRISMVETRVEAPDGTIFERDVVRHPGAVAVVALTERSTVLLVRQYRTAVDELLLEIPAGTRDVEGEPPEETASRELADEVGVVAGRLERLGDFYNSPGFCDEHTVLFLATDLEAGPMARSGIEEAHMEIVEVPVDAFDALVSAGTLDALTAIGLLLVRARLRTGPPA
jgi:8-oxo-dGTP pyrophosphatase MutT (NUDIX family)